jgi:hypothetical protein
MTDAKEPLVIEYLRQEARDGSVFLYDVCGGAVCATSTVLAAFDTLTRERDEALVMLGWTKESSLWQAAAAANQEVGHIRAERDALKAQLAAARVLLKSVPSALNAAFSAGAEEHENGSYRRQEKQMETVYAMRKAITVALTQGDA